MGHMLIRRDEMFALAPPLRVNGVVKPSRWIRTPTNRIMDGRATRTSSFTRQCHD